MATTFTDNFSFAKPDQGATAWHTILNGFFDDLDSYLGDASRLYGEAGEDISAYEVVYYKFSDGKIWLADGSDETTLGVIAIAGETFATGVDGTSLRFGRITNGSWTWTPGAILWVSASTPGEITETRPATEAVCIGIALSATEIFFDPNMFKRRKELIRIGGLADSNDFYVLVKDHTIHISKVEILCDTTTASSDGTDNWVFTLHNLTDAANIASATTNGSEITGDTIYDLGTVSNPRIDPNDILELQIVKNASPTDLTSAEVALLIEYHERRY